MLIAFLENNLNEDGSIRIPAPLRPYMGGKEVPCAGEVRKNNRIKLGCQANKLDSPPFIQLAKNSVMDHVRRGLNPPEDSLPRIAGQISVGRLRHERANRFDMAVVDELTNVRRADGLALRLRAGDDDQLNARLGQNRRKRLIIQARRVRERAPRRRSAASDSAQPQCG